MNRVQRYLFRNAGIATMVTLVGLGGMIWLSQAIRQLDLVTGKGQTIWLFLHATFLVLPQLILVIMPIALFIGIITTLNRLNADSELIVMTAAGMRPWQIAKPFAILALIVALFCALLSHYVLPTSLRNLREIVTLVRTDIITRILEAGRFVELDSGIVFHYRAKGEGESLEGVLVQDKRDPEAVSTYIAERGQLKKLGEASYLVLETGSLQRQTPNGNENAIVTFKQYAFDLGSFGSNSGSGGRSLNEMSTLELLTLEAAPDDSSNLLGRARTEANERFVAPLFAFAAAAIAFAGLGVARTTRQGRGFAIFLTVCLLIAGRAAAFGAFTIAPRSATATIIMYVLPIGLTLGSMAYAFWSASPRLVRPSRMVAFQQAAT